MALRSEFARNPRKVEDFESNTSYKYLPCAKPNRTVAAVFTGQASHQKNMFSELALNWPEFRQTFENFDKTCTKMLGCPITPICYPRASYGTEKSGAAEDNSYESWTCATSTSGAPNLPVSCISTVACSVGLYRVLQSAGFLPSALLGHSLGEMTALWASGCLSENQLVEILCKRSLRPPHSVH